MTMVTFAAIVSDMNTVRKIQVDEFGLESKTSEHNTNVVLMSLFRRQLQGASAGDINVSRNSSTGKYYIAVMRQDGSPVFFTGNDDDNQIVHGVYVDHSGEISTFTSYTESLCDSLCCSFGEPPAILTGADLAKNIEKYIPLTGGSHDKAIYDAAEKMAKDMVREVVKDVMKKHLEEEEAHEKLIESLTQDLRKAEEIVEKLIANTKKESDTEPKPGFFTMTPLKKKLLIGSAVTAVTAAAAGAAWWYKNRR